MADLRDALDNAIRLGNVGGLTRKGCVTAVLPVVEQYLATSKQKLQQLRASYELLKGDFGAMREQRDSARAEVEQLKAKLTRDHDELRDKRTDLLNIRGILKPADRMEPVVPMPLGHMVAPAVEWLAGEKERLREQRDRARMAIARADRIWQDADEPVDAAALAEVLADVAKLCPGCWRMHGLWCHPYGGPMADPDPTAYQRALDGGES